MGRRNQHLFTQHRVLRGGSETAFVPAHTFLAPTGPGRREDILRDVARPSGNYSTPHGGDRFSTLRLSCPTSDTRQADSLEEWHCPQCKTSVYVGQEGVDELLRVDMALLAVTAGRKHSIDILGPKCRAGCNAVMERRKIG